MAVWAPWYLYPTYLGVFVVGIGAAGIYYGSHDNDSLRVALGFYEMFVGVILFAVGSLLKKRFEERKVVEKRP